MVANAALLAAVNVTVNATVNASAYLGNASATLVASVASGGESTSILAAHVLPIIGVCLSNFMYLSTVKNVLVVWGREDRRLGALNPWVVVGGLLRCLGCVLYSTLPSVRDPYIFMAEFPGMCGCLWAMLRVHAMALNSSRDVRLKTGDIVQHVEANMRRVRGGGGIELYKQLELGVVGCLAFWVLLLGASAILFGDFAHPPLVAVGTLLSAVLMYIAPALAFAEAMRTRSAEAFYLPNVAATVLNSLLWGGYGAFARRLSNCRPSAQY